MAGRYEEDLFEQTGPYEPITTRIRNILREYKDGVGIFKELIQNADDAGATTVKFLVDWRRGPTDSLFSPGMAECQGPALWAYNDAVFTDKDFENINKLAGETKVEDLSKIGRFGLGFNAVYHLTDVPSFVSRDTFVIFDPNAHHLEHLIRDRSRPGIRINLAKKADALTRYHDQFQPYNGVFGCSTTQTRGGFNYNGTLFRFPFRTAPQASTSDISKIPYGRDRIQTIVCSLCECASTLLLFSQHVKKVEIYELDRSHPPDQMQLVLSVNKPSIEALRSKGVKSNEPFIKQCSKWWQQYRDFRQSCAEYPSGCELVNITTTKEPSELSQCDCKYSHDEMWFVASTSGTNVSLAVARSPEGQSHGLLPCGGAAFVIQRVSGQGSWKFSIASDISGELFCFLPLSIPTGLPVHVNGYFAIMSNRVEIWKRTAMRNQPIEVTWNETLMEDALSRAYIMLLEEMKEFSRNVKDYEFHSLWPSCDGVDMKSWAKLVQKVCSVLLEQKSELFYSDGKWMSINDGFLLSDVFYEIYDIAVDVLKSQGKHVFNLPSKILKTLAKFDQQGILQRRTLTLTAFMQEHFFPNIKKISPAQRDAIVCFGLDLILKEDKSLGKLFQKNACVAVSNESLVKPCQLIHPYGDAAQLFSKGDRRFPFGNDLCDYKRLYVLETLGMVKDLDWEGIYERAESIARLDFHAGTERSRKLIEYLNKRIGLLPTHSVYRNLLQRVKFMSVLNKPVDEYPLPWKGSSSLFARLSAPVDVFLPKNANLVGSSCYIVNTSSQSGCGELNDDVEDLFGFSNRLPEDKFVIQQLDEAIKFWCKLPEAEKQDTSKSSAIESVCQEIYEFFNNRVSEKAANINFLNEFRKRDWLFFQGKFVQSKKVAYTSNGNGVPFLFTLPSNYKRDYRNLFGAMEIKHTFDEEDYISALYELQRKKYGSVLTEDELQLAIFFISQISDDETPAVKKHIGNIPLPDTNRILRPSKDVVVNLSLWLEDPGDNQRVHEKIPPQTARALGAKPLKNAILKKYSRPIDHGVSFGQHENLTDRLRGILDGYPPDGILKELVQNADDAQASEIHFIYDTRTLASEKVVTERETSDEIQGPALCVYNDRPFEDKDLNGIKLLGIGSKRDSPGMTGKYGIGFNSVYHLTDCPSFLSNDDTLVLLDPHCRYVPGADSDGPGALFKPINEKFRNDFSDTLDRYLSGHFNLQGSTMFRFPLRGDHEFQSKISSVPVDMENLLLAFQKEALKSLLFLNHIKKIALSKIGPSNKFEKIYRVQTVITPENDKKRHEMARKICDLSGTPTAEIGWEEVSYTLTIKENNKKVEKWLIQKCIGSTPATHTTNSTSDEEQDEIPDGRKLGLLPRGDLAARLWTHSSPSDKNEKLCGTVYCFLPLPENSTNLPVHVNGHFALDSTRRGLWTETDGKGPKFEWNHFIKRCVLPPAYAALITEAKEYLCNDKNDNQLLCYHALFPKVLTDSPWKTLVVELYRYLGQTRAKVLPLLIPTEAQPEASTSIPKKTGTFNSPKPPTHVTCTGWLSADQAYFVSAGEEHVLHLLIRIGLPVLLHAPFEIHRGFVSADTTSHTVTPTSVIDFLRDFKSPGSTCKIGQLPKKLDTTAVKSVPELSALIEYCFGVHRVFKKDFKKHLKGLPLLLTQDGFLRVFDSRQPVFGSEFGDLIPTQSHLFIHSEIVYLIAWIATNAKENIVRDFTVRHLAELLPHVFTQPAFKYNEDHVKWDFPPEGILSRSWFQRLWDYLQNYTKPARGEDFVSLECLSEWPVIPTTCGKLVTIEKAKTVLDMTVTGRESTAQDNVCTFISNLKCPILLKEITFKDKHSSFASGTNDLAEDQTTSKKTTKSVNERKPAVTDPYVAHPHNVEDVLQVLHHMLKTNRLHVSAEYEDKIHNFLQFVQDDCKASERLEEYKKIIKCLPFHKALDGQFVSLTGQYSSYALVPSGVPIQQLEELQARANCLFLDSDALPTLEKLYSDLGVIAGQNVTQFYVEYVFKHYSMFTRESQMQHLIYIKDEVHPSFPQGGSYERGVFLKSMNQIACIPDENGDLHLACEFYDPNNKVFKIMFKDEQGKFPPSPFDNEDWFKLLQDIGLRVEITPKLFLKLCTTVAEVGRQSPSNPQNHERSRMLVKCLFSKEALQKKKFVSQLSQIKFLAPAKIDEELTSIHEQYQCPEKGYPPFIEFRNAVPWRFRDISWTTVSILPIWVQPGNIELQNLGIARYGPTYTKVVDHLQNVVTSYSPDRVDSNLLHVITKSIYKFLWEVAKCRGGNPTDSCSNVCIDIGDQLKGLPCIFLQEDEIFVNAEQLVIKLPENCPLKPFLYPVPREFGDLEHFLRRLGATVQPKPSQIAYVFKTMHDHVGDQVLSPEEEYRAKYAMYLLFELLYKGECADAIDELYLPSQDKRLVKSCKLVCKVSSRFTDVVENLHHPILLRFEECKLKKSSDDYINALPKHLRPVKFEDLVREDVDPECKDSICPEAQQGSTCNFQQRFESLLRSEEFQEGLRRLLMADRKDPKEFEHIIRKLQTSVLTKCTGVESIKISIINRDDDVISIINCDDDRLKETCCAVQEEDSWSLYMQHEFKDDNRSLVSITSCVNKILGGCINKALELSAMLGCSSPSDISNKLNKRGIIQSLSTSANDFNPPDDDIYSGWDNGDSGIRRDDGNEERGGFGGGGGTRMGGGRTRMGGGGSRGINMSTGEGASFNVGGYGIGYRGGGGGHSRTIGDEVERFFPISREEAMRWVKQSKIDLEGAKWLLQSNPPFSALACFQSQQVTEKCLKAMLFAEWGISGELLGLHKISQLESTVRDKTEMPDQTVRLARGVEGYYLSTRYPNCQPLDVVPAEAFTKEEAERAIEVASKVLKYVEDYLQ